MRLCRLAAVAAAVLMAGACGNDQQTGGGGALPRADSSASQWVTVTADVTGVRPAADPRSALLDVRVSAGRADCLRDPRVTYLAEENGLVYANVVVDIQQDAGCTGTTAATVTLTATAPLGTRGLVLNSADSVWAPSAGGYRQCLGPWGCGTPPADPCDQAWIDVAVAGLDMPQHSTKSVRHCDRSWLVVEVNTAASMCGPAEGQRPGCTVSPQITRWFLRFQDGWRAITGTREAGCAAVHAVEPAFPAARCANLPALPGSR